MITDPVSTAAVDYLQRVQMVPAVGGGAASVAPLSARRVVRVAGVGQPTRTPPRPADGTPVEPATLPLLVGLAGAGAPVAFLLEGHGRGVTVRLGTWAADGVGDAALDARQAMRSITVNVLGSGLCDGVAASLAWRQRPRGRAGALPVVWLRQPGRLRVLRAVSGGFGAPVPGVRRDGASRGRGVPGLRGVAGWDGAAGGSRVAARAR